MTIPRTINPPPVAPRYQPAVSTFRGEPFPDIDSQPVAPPRKAPKPAKGAL